MGLVMVNSLAVWQMLTQCFTHFFPEISSACHSFNQQMELLWRWFNCHNVICKYVTGHMITDDRLWKGIINPVSVLWWFGIRCECLPWSFFWSIIFQPFPGISSFPNHFLFKRIIRCQTLYGNVNIHVNTCLMKPLRNCKALNDHVSLEPPTRVKFEFERHCSQTK